MNLSSSGGGVGPGGIPNSVPSPPNSSFPNHYLHHNPNNHGQASNSPTAIQGSNNGGTRSASVPTQIASYNSSNSSIGSSLNGSQSSLVHPRPMHTGPGQQHQSMPGSNLDSNMPSQRSQLQQQPQPPNQSSQQYASRNAYSPVS